MKIKNILINVSQHFKRFLRHFMQLLFYFVIYSKQSSQISISFHFFSKQLLDAFSLYD